MVDKKLNLFIYLSPIAISPNNSVKICPRKQKTDMLYQMDNTFHTLSQYPVWINPGEFPGEGLVRKTIPRRKAFGFFTSTILPNLAYPGDKIK